MKIHTASRMVYTKKAAETYHFGNSSVRPSTHAMLRAPTQKRLMLSCVCAADPAPQPAGQRRSRPKDTALLFAFNECTHMMWRMLLHSVDTVHAVPPR